MRYPGRPYKAPWQFWIHLRTEIQLLCGSSQETLNDSEGRLKGTRWRKDLPQNLTSC